MKNKKRNDREASLKQANLLQDMIGNKIMPARARLMKDALQFNGEKLVLIRKSTLEEIKKMLAECEMLHGMLENYIKKG